MMIMAAAQCAIVFGQDINLRKGLVPSLKCLLAPCTLPVRRHQSICCNRCTQHTHKMMAIAHRSTIVLELCIDLFARGTAAPLVAHIVAHKACFRIAIILIMLVAAAQPAPLESRSIRAVDSVVSHFLATVTPKTSRRSRRKRRGGIPSISDHES